MTSNSNRGHAFQMLALTVVLRPFGNLSIAFGMKHIPQLLAFDPLPYLSAFANPYVSGGILMLVLSLLTRMALMSIVDLSAILPLTSVGYILSVFLASKVLGEQVSLRQWTGTLLIFGGVLLVSSTRLNTSSSVKKSAAA